MHFVFRAPNMLIAMIVASTLVVVGCGDFGSGTASVADADYDEGHDRAAGEAHDDARHDHSGWWCPEHGVPEDVCTRCDSRLIADFQDKGDWCDEHERPDSQCFRCHPELEAKFAARYEAKYGNKPPKPSDL
jgi:hypothetical protein